MFLNLKSSPVFSDHFLIETFLKELLFENDIFRFNDIGIIHGYNPYKYYYANDNNYWKQISSVKEFVNLFIGKNDFKS